MKRKWKPSRSERREFARNMQDPEFAEAYRERKEKRAASRRAGSKFDYSTAGGEYVPNRVQYDFCMQNIEYVDSDKKEAFAMVIYGYNAQEKIHHDHIHIVNECIRNNSI